MRPFIFKTVMLVLSLAMANFACNTLWISGDLYNKQPIATSLDKVINGPRNYTNKIVSVSGIVRRPNYMGIAGTYLLVVPETNRQIYVLTWEFPFEEGDAITVTGEVKPIFRNSHYESIFLLEKSAVKQSKNSFLPNL